jgi:hypothetical protein
MTSTAELILAAQLEQARIPFEREIPFDRPRRRFRADFGIFLDSAFSSVYLQHPILVEVEGGTWISGRHSRGSGFESDCEKQALAVIAGYRYLRVTSTQVEDGRALDWIKQALGLR